MDPNILRLIPELTKPEGASEHSIAVVEQALGLSLPEDYKAFMRYSNGAYGTVGEVYDPDGDDYDSDEDSRGYVEFYPMEEILKVNEGYHVQEFAPGLFFFATSGGGEAYAFDMRSNQLPIVEVPFIPLRLDHARQCGRTLLEFLNYLGSQE